MTKPQLMKLIGKQKYLFWVEENQKKQYSLFFPLPEVTLFRSSRPEMFCKKGVLRNFAKFTEKHLCQSLFLLKLPTQACDFI